MKISLLEICLLFHQYFLYFINLYIIKIVISNLNSILTPGGCTTDRCKAVAVVMFAFHVASCWVPCFCSCFICSVVSSGQIASHITFMLQIYLLSAVCFLLLSHSMT